MSTTGKMRIRFERRFGRSPRPVIEVQTTESSVIDLNGSGYYDFMDKRIWRYATPGECARMSEFTLVLE